MRFLLAALIFSLSALAQPQQEFAGSGFVVRYATGDRGLAIEFLNEFPRARLRVEAFTGTRLADGITVEIATSIHEFRKRLLDLASWEVPKWVAGVALPKQNLVLVRADLQGAYEERVRGLLVHELCHLAIGERRKTPTAAAIPRWLDEGLAQVAEGRLFVDAEPHLPMRAFFGTLIDLEDLVSVFPEGEGASNLAYAQAESFVSFLLRHPRIDRAQDLLDRIEVGVALEDALAGMTLQSLSELEAAWIASLRGEKAWMVTVGGPFLFGVLVILTVAIALPRHLRRRRLAQAQPEDAEPTIERATEEIEEFPKRRQRHPGFFPLRGLRDDDSPLPDETDRPTPS